MTTDSELLRQYAVHGDEAAFAQVVRRHTDLVYSVALRVARDPALAQDVTQIVFTRLARQARLLGGYPTLVGWLHTTTRHTAINAIRGEARRRAREQETMTMHNTLPVSEVKWEQLQPILDEAVGQLGERDRQAVLLRYFNGLSHQEVGAVLGLSENSANKRVARALEKLRGHFSRRGVTLSSALLATAMSENSVQAAPTGLAERTTETSLAGAGAAAESIFLKFLFMSTKPKLIIAAVIVLMSAAMFLCLPQAPRVIATAENAKPASPAPVTAPAKSSTLAAPRLAPTLPPVAVAAPMPAPIPAATTSEPSPKPQADLHACIIQTIKLLEANDMLNFVKTVVSPDGLKAAIASGSEEDLAALFGQRYPQMMSQLQLALESIKDQTPVLNADGTQAAFKLDPSLKYYALGVSGQNIVFFKSNGFWYLR